VHVFRRLVAELDRRPGLVGALVLREPDVPVNAEQRASLLLRDRQDRRTDRGERLLKRGSERQERFPDVAFVAGPVALEPGPLVVLTQIVEETEQLRRDRSPISICLG